MSRHRLTLRLLPETFAICRLDPHAPLPAWVPQRAFTASIRTADELCVYCAGDAVPPDVRAERGWRALQLVGPFDFSEFGVIASVAGPLAEAGISISVLATFDTDYIFVRAEALESAVEILQAGGHRIAGPD
ncbi:MAG TPA: ACT domain-containing protein [Candidatus Acidoferrales bacterium]|nr:ACT domain-containing protein [Candidatus Acidoferrales bacterium]